MTVHAAPSRDAYSDLCQSIQSILNSQVCYNGSSSYADSLQQYFSIQEASLHPKCFVDPTSAQDVATIVRAISQARKQNNEIQFAVKSGGHTAWPGSANIDGGITIDLKNLNTVQVSEDQKSTSIGPGARWRDVYSKLDAMGLSVVGGRAAQVGVGGLTLGGGMSFFSPKEGFACDNVIEFEIVLADGSIQQANNQTNRDLWTALKGGSNNFGIVTRFTVNTFQQGQLWGGINFSPGSAIPSQLQAFHNFTSDPNYDENAALIQSITYNSTRGTIGVANNMHYTIPVEKPEALKPFWNAESQYSTLRTTDLLDLTTELGAFSPNGRGEIYITTTFRSDPTMLQKAYDLWVPTTNSLSDVQNLFWSLIFQPLPPAITSKTDKHGIDPLGLSGNPPLVLALISSAWDLDSDTPRVVQTAKNLISNIDNAAVETGTTNRYRYLNYAYEGQDPITGYGSDNKAFLQKVSRDYDPDGLFQTGCPGGFKLFDQGSDVRAHFHVLPKRHHQLKLFYRARKLLARFRHLCT
ncbi:MAG: hypothetical protein Q9159_001030 [Coniocarpon cinnabarinum]